MAAKNSSRAGRVRKQSSRLKDNALFLESSFKETRWCKVLCIEDNKSYYCPIAKLETDDGLGLTSTDILVGKKVIWKYKGKPYEAEIVSVYDKNPKSAPSKDAESDSEDQQTKDGEEQTEINTSLSSTAIGRKYFLGQGNENDYSSSSITKVKRPKLCEQPNTDTESQTENFEEMEISQSSSSSSSLVASDLLKKIWDRQDKIEKKINKILIYLKPPPTILDISEEITAPEFVTENGINLLSFGIRQPDKYALALLDALFSEEQLASSCYVATKRSKKQPLPEEKVAILENVLKKLFGEKIMNGSEGKTIRQKCNQKCIDLFNKKIRVKKEMKKDHEQAQEEEEEEESQEEE